LSIFSGLSISDPEIVIANERLFRTIGRNGSARPERVDTRNARFTAVIIQAATKKFTLNGKKNRVGILRKFKRSERKVER
jgi:hypothetical protein